MVQYGFIMTEIHFYFYNHIKLKYFSHVKKSSSELRGTKSLSLWPLIKYAEEILKM